jgi:hypothetical protein
MVLEAFLCFPAATLPGTLTTLFFHQNFSEPAMATRRLVLAYLNSPFWPEAFILPLISISISFVSYSPFHLLPPFEDTPAI